MTYDQIETLITIVEEGSFKAASVALHKSQPSLSVAIKKLEEEFQIQLFNREAYRPKLTDAGRAFYEKAKQVEYDFKGLEGLAKSLGEGVEGYLKLSVDALTPIPKLGKILENFFKDKTTELLLSVEVLEGTWEKVLSSEADIGLGPLFESENQFNKMEIGRLEMIPVVAKDKKVSELPQIVVKSTGVSTEINMGLSEGKKWFVTDNGTKTNLILQGMGWGRLPYHLVEEGLQRNILTEVKNNQVKKEKLNYCIYTKKDKQLGPVGTKLLQCLKNEFKI